MEEEVVNASEEAVMMASTTAPGQQLGEAVTSVTQNASTFFHWIKTFITWENLFKVVGIENRIVYLKGVDLRLVADSDIDDLVKAKVDDSNEDKNIIVYGHNMRNGTMFNNITKFKEDSFFNSNDTINIIRNNTLYQYEIFSVYVEDESKVSLDIEFIDDEAFVKYVSNEGLKSMYNKDITISKEDKIITLVTCSYEYDGARTVLVGKLKV